MDAPRHLPQFRITQASIIDDREWRFQLLHIQPLTIPLPTICPQLLHRRISPTPGQRLSETEPGPPFIEPVTRVTTPTAFPEARSNNWVSAKFKPGANGFEPAILTLVSRMLQRPVSQVQAAEPFKTRAYQIEMFQESLRILCVLGVRLLIGRVDVDIYELPSFFSFP